MGIRPVPALLFARVPEPGKVKTRLQGAVKAGDAARLATAFIQDSWAVLENHADLKPILATTGALDKPLDELDSWLQGEGDLGDRLERMMRRALMGGGPTLVLGADTPGLPKRLLDQALDALSSADAVLGPCEDGGFYLLGLRRCPPGVLADIPWSDPSTCECVKQRLEEHGMRVITLEPWFDVDRPADLDRLALLIANGSIMAERTQQLLRSLPGLTSRTAQARSGAASTISVIIPTLNEEARIAKRLDELDHMPGITEVIVVDGGSTDRTSEIVSRRPNVRLVCAPKGRATQMNRGAAEAAGDVLLFLHADVSPPPDAARWVNKALSNKAVGAGAFRTWTVVDAGTSWAAPFLHLADMRSRYTSLPYGDQAIFVRTSCFHEVGGYPEIELMEDLAFCQRLREVGEIKIVAASVRVSGRRFLARPIYYTALVNILPLLFRLGVPAARLAKFYGDPR